MVFLLMIVLQKHIQYHYHSALTRAKLITQRPRHTLTAAVHVLPTWLVTAQEVRGSGGLFRVSVASLQAEHDMDNLRPVDVLQRGRSHVVARATADHRDFALQAATATQRAPDWLV